MVSNVCVGPCTLRKAHNDADVYNHNRGRLVKDRGTGMPKMSCRNWECGVVVQVPKTVAYGKKQNAAHSTMEVFDGTVPIPMKTPGSPYGPSDEPWFFVRT